MKKKKMNYKDEIRDVRRRNSEELMMRRMQKVSQKEFIQEGKECTWDYTIGTTTDEVK